MSDRARGVAAKVAELDAALPPAPWEHTGGGVVRYTNGAGTRSDWYAGMKPPSALAFVELRNIAPALPALIEAAAGMPACDQGDSFTSEGTYCFTCHEVTPCAGDNLRAALAAVCERSDPK